jgi:hypothetical protein
VLIQLAGVPALAQSAPITTPPKIISPPAAVLPDLWAPVWDVTLTCVGTPSVTATFAVTIQNRDKIDADLTKHPYHHIVTARLEVGDTGALFAGDPGQVIVSPGAGPAVLKGGAIAKTKVTITNIPRYKKSTSYPFYRFSIIVDPDNLVHEANESNNISTKQVFNTCH